QPIAVASQILLVLEETGVVELGAVTGVVPVANRQSAGHLEDGGVLVHAGNLVIAVAALDADAHPGLEGMLTQGTNAAQRGIQVWALGGLALRPRLIAQSPMFVAEPSRTNDRVEDRPLPRGNTRVAEVDDDSPRADFGGGVQGVLDRIDGEHALGLVNRSESVRPACAFAALGHWHWTRRMQAGNLHLALRRKGRQLAQLVGCEVSVCFDPTETQRAMLIQERLRIAAWSIP